MTEQEIQQLIFDMREHFGYVYKGKTANEVDKIIMDIFLQEYCENRMSKEDLITLTRAMGYAAEADILDQIEIEIERKGECEE